jgi:hypothetical protein
MAKMAAIGDLFGDVPQRCSANAPPRPSEHHSVEPRSMLYPPVPPNGHSADTIRSMALDILAEARNLETLDWTPRKLRSHTAMFPYMAEWLKNGEGDQLMLEFKAEMDRLNAPVDQVAPNWQRIWGLAA